MYICPVCKTKSSTLCCSACGFDGSRNYERYPTLSRLPKPTDSVSRQKSALSGYLRCSTCGSLRFLADIESAQLVCAICKKAIDIRQAFPSEQETDSAEDKTKGGRGGSFVYCPPLEPQGIQPAPSRTQNENPRETDISFRQMQKTHEHWSAPASFTRRVGTSAAQSQNSLQDWRKSEAAYREWKKSLESSPDKD